MELDQTLRESSRKIILQRIRNRVIEYFELAGDPLAQERFGPDAVINSWEDWRSISPASDYPEPVFTPEEHRAMIAFDSVWEVVADSTSNPMPPIEQLRSDQNWIALCIAAQTALTVFLHRGRLSED